MGAVWITQIDIDIADFVAKFIKTNIAVWRDADNVIIAASILFWFGLGIIGLLVGQMF